jgi:hypothetical protein
MLAAIATVPLAAQSAPSQLELNGFLIGQHRSVFVAALGKPYQEQRTPDGWTYQIFIVDQARGVYMVVKFPDDRPNNAIALQLTGDSSKKVLPFLGLRLGVDTSAVLRVLGSPSSRRAIDEPKLTLWTYEDRNYTVEFTPAGRLYSIQLMGYTGFPTRTPESLPIAKLRQALAERNRDELIGLLAPDIEVFRDSSVISFEGAMRAQLADSTSPIARELMYGDRNLGVVLSAPNALEGSDEVLRIHERPRAGAMYRVLKFPERSPLKELVFEFFAGELRLWEVAWR